MYICIFIASDLYNDLYLVSFVNYFLFICYSTRIYAVCNYATNWNCSSLQYIIAIIQANYNISLSMNMLTVEPVWILSKLSWVTTSNLKFRTYSRKQFFSLYCEYWFFFISGQMHNDDKIVQIVQILQDFFVTVTSKVVRKLRPTYSVTVLAHSYVIASRFSVCKCSLISGIISCNRLFISSKHDLRILWIVPVMSELYGLSVLCMGGASGTCLAEWWCHHAMKISAVLWL